MAWRLHAASFSLIAVPLSYALLSWTIVTLSLPAAYLALKRSGVLDVPNARSSHDRPIIRGGGIACALGVAVTFAICGPYDKWPLILAPLAIAAVGFMDDVLGLSVRVRLPVQVTLGATLAFVIHGPDASSLLLGAFVMPLLVNAVNFMDGLNGMTGLAMVAWSLCVILSTTDQAWMSGLSLGAAIAFLPWNIPRARMFMGDSGSYLFGGIPAALVISEGTILTPTLLPLIPYLYDVISTLLRRFARKADLTSPHREHLYQLTQRRRQLSHLAVSLNYAVQAIIIFLAWHLSSNSWVGVTVTSLVLGASTHYALRSSTRESRQ